jgi:hypothetical protein
VLIVRRVRRPVGEHDDRRVVAGLRRGSRTQRLPKLLVRGLERAHAHAAGDGQVRAQRLPRRDRVSDPRRGAYVVLEHRKRAIAVAHEIQTGDHDPPTRRGLDLGHARLEVLRALDRREGHAARGEDPALTVHVGHEPIEGLGALHEADFERGPLVTLDHARDRVDDESFHIPIIGRAERDLSRPELIGQRPRERA